MIEKLHVATRKLETPTSTGIGCLSIEGAKTGSEATKSSIRMNKTAKTHASVLETMTKVLDHW